MFAKPSPIYTFTSVPASSTYPPPPPHSYDDDSDGKEFGDDDDDDHHGSAKSPHSSTPSLADPTTTVTLLKSTSSQTTFTSSAVPSFASTTRADAAIATSTTPGTSNQSEGTPLNIADPAHETEAGSSGLGKAGIILAAVFGFVALATTFYLFLRVCQRRKSYRDQASWPGRSGTFNNQTSIEKAIAEPPTYPPCTTQETGIKLARKSPAGSRPNNNNLELRAQGRFSFLNRRWYSTDSQVTAPGAARSETGFSTTPSSPSRWAALLFALGFQASHANASENSFAAGLNPISNMHPSNTVNISTSDIQRNASQCSTGSGHARAYAHHNVQPPHKTPRPTVSSMSSRWLSRRSEASRTISETNEVYRGYSPSSSQDTMSMSLSFDGSEGSKRSRESTGIPRLPLPVAVNGGGMRLSV